MSERAKARNRAACPDRGQHGGDLRRLGRQAGRKPEDLLDFSVNVRPEGPPDFIVAALWRAMGELAAYPSPHAEEAMEAAALHHFGSAEAAPFFTFGNGSNELIHALMRVLYAEGRRVLTVLEPAFSEYALAGAAAGLEVRHAPCDAAFMPQWEEVERLSPPGAVVILANPGNPSGLFVPPEQCRSWFEKRPDLAFVVDEAFIDYVSADRASSLLPLAPARDWIVLRSLTKFHAVPSLRLGYAVSSAERAARLRAALPAWTVNSFALAAACAVFADKSDYADQTRRVNQQRRADLISHLQSLPVELFPSEANYLLFRWHDEPSRIAEIMAGLLTEHGIVLRHCANYHGLEDGTWFRAAVRFPEEHQRLADALHALNTFAPNKSPVSGAVSAPVRKRKKPALMLQGTSSNAGKSVLAAAFCRILQQDGYSVAPFKAQNMSLNSGVTADGKEMGRAQLVQAQACRVAADARMNPILLKPHSDTGSQVILLGQALGHMGVRDYFQAKRDLWPEVRRAYDSLAAEHEVMVLEGAGSPGEINLKDGDLVNMRMAAHAGASVLVVGDIDRGGVYASFLGTWQTFSPPEQRLVTGFLVNRFRGDASLLGPAHDFLLARTGRPVLGVVPYIRDLGLPEEDMAGSDWKAGPSQPQAKGQGERRPLDVAVLLLRHVSNDTDFAPLALEPDLRLRPVRRVEDWGEPDIVLLPGSKNVAADLAHLRQSGLAQCLLRHAGADAQKGGWIFGICGGLQMLGRCLLDPEQVESNEPRVEGLALLDLETRFGARKTLIRVEEAQTPLGLPSAGYEIHHGGTVAGPSALPLFRRSPHEGESKGEDAGLCGYVCGRRWATYLHGIFDNDAFRRAFLDHVRSDLGLRPQGRVLVRYDVERSLDRLADLVRASVDLQDIYQSMGLK